MAHSLSAKKRIRQNEKHHARNRARKDVIKVQTKAFHASAAAGDTVKAEVDLNKLVSKLDRTAAQHTIHKNTAARKRSRLTLKLNVLKKTAASAT